MAGFARYTRVAIVDPCKRHATGAALLVIIRRVVVACFTIAFPDLVFDFAGDTRFAPVLVQ